MDLVSLPDKGIDLIPIHKSTMQFNILWLFIATSQFTFHWFFLCKFAKFIYLFLFTLCSASWIVVDGCQSVSFTQCFLYRICSQISINLWPWSDLCLYSVTLDIFLQKFELWAFKKSIWNVFWVFTVLKYLEKQKKIKLTNQQIRLFLKQQ